MHVQLVFMADPEDTEDVLPSAILPYVVSLVNRKRRKPVFLPGWGKVLGAGVLGAWCWVVGAG